MRTLVQAYQQIYKILSELFWIFFVPFGTFRTYWTFFGEADSGT